jgi:phosphoribosyl-ATP pyrophosphohydrolase
MIGVAMYITIKSLWERHKNKSLIARLTGHDWKTVAKRIKEITEEDLITLINVGKEEDVIEEEKND